MSTKIIIGGDLVPTKNNYTLFEQAHILELFGSDLLAVLKASNSRYVTIHLNKMRLFQN